MMETLLKGFSRLFNSQVAHSKASQKAFENYYRQLLNSPLYALYDRAVHGGPGNSFNMMGPYQWECLQEWLEENPLPKCFRSRLWCRCALFASQRQAAFKVHWH